MNELLIEGIFGNEAGEDEDPDFLEAYFVEKEDFRRFWNFEERFVVVRARKGMGKSTLLAKSEHNKKADNPNAIVVYAKGADLVQFFRPNTGDPNCLINAWQQALCALINLEIGRKMKVAFTDTSVTLVENAELSGYRGRNLVGCLLDRLVTKLPIATVKKPAENHPQLLYRFGQAREFKSWLLIDDIDATFVNSPEMCLQVSTFLSACRKMAREYRGIAIRASLRTDVWSVIKIADEALDKVGQYMIDISWSRAEALQISSRKIHAFARRNRMARTEVFHMDPRREPDAILEQVFLPKLRWGGSFYKASDVTYMLSDGRPRWSAQLGKLAVSFCRSAKRDRINSDDVMRAMAVFGRTRLDDLYREHRHQCPSLSTLIEIFAGGPALYSTSDLLEQIQTKVVEPSGPIELEGTNDNVDALGLARFLFRIGFIQGKKADDSDLIDAVRFEERMELLYDPVNLDDGLTWAINPSYREVLRVSSALRANSAGPHNSIGRADG